MKLRHIGIVVQDLELALGFWQGIMGFKVVKQMDESGPFIDNLLGESDVKVITVKMTGLDGNMVELLKFKSHRSTENWNGSVYSTGLTHIAFTVDDLSELYNRLNNNGLTFKSPPLVSDDGGARVAYAAGPEGLLVELVEMLNEK